MTDGRGRVEHGLDEPDLLDEAYKVFVEAALDAVYEAVEAELDQLGATSRSCSTWPCATR